MSISSVFGAGQSSMLSFFGSAPIGGLGNISSILGGTTGLGGLTGLDSASFTNPLGMMGLPSSPTAIDDFLPLLSMLGGATSPTTIPSAPSAETFVADTTPAPAENTAETTEPLTAKEKRAQRREERIATRDAKRSVDRASL